VLPIVFSGVPPRSSRLRPVVIGRPRPVRRLPRRARSLAGPGRGRWGERAGLAGEPVGPAAPASGADLAERVGELERIFAGYNCKKENP
jgi:hypothetical protein